MKKKLPELHLTVQPSRNRTAISKRTLSSAIKKSIDLFNDAINCEVFLTSAADG
jgi:hypothetical protein